ncbi:MAG: helix-turn-helix domain-containing protein, partial [Lachnospiraceae bacterium]|nr:helix-turn-helix domain-containing protein [Lachnospiraceae bacterium]
MLDNQKIASFIANKRKELDMTQAEAAQILNVSFQAVSKWENGTLPNVEMLVELAALLNVSVDEILAGREFNNENFSYSKAGVDICYTDAIKKDMAKFLKTENPRVLNGLGAFASLYDISFPEIQDPVLVLKSEEPGSKQKLALEYGYSKSICHDMVNHLVNDIAVMGAAPLAVLDTIVSGSAEKDTINSFIKRI